MAKEKNLYELLQVQQNADKKVVKAAWKALMQDAHPDKGGSDDLAAKLNQAKSILLNSKKRSEYDSYLLKQQEGIIGNYRLLEQIAEGGFGITYLAEHILLKEKACLKQNINISPEDTEIIVKEAKLLWQIHHYSLPTLRDFFKTPDGSCVLAMTYIEGPSIDKIIEKHKKIDPEHVCWMSQRLMNALHYLHFHGIVHCDVKPNNIIIKPEEHNAILVDYGFSSLKPKQKTKPDGYTEVFAAPELLALKPPLPQTDLYSLALTMMYALGGNPITHQYPKDTPPEIKDYFNSFLEKNPLKRPSWEDKDLIKELSDVRMKVFGRRTSDKKLEV